MLLASPTGKEMISVRGANPGLESVSLAQLRDCVAYSKQVPVISAPVKMMGTPIGNRIDGLVSTDDIVGAVVAAPGLQNGTVVTRIITAAVDPTPVSPGKMGSVEISTSSQAPVPVEPVEVEFSWPSTPVHMMDGARYLIIRPRWPISLAEKQAKLDADKQDVERQKAELEKSTVSNLPNNPGESDADYKARNDANIARQKSENAARAKAVPVVSAPQPKKVEVKALEALTVYLPPNPLDGQIAHIFSAAPITILTVEPADGQALAIDFSGPIEADKAIEFLYSANDFTWDRCY
jgi:hypothetical protein